MCGFVCGVPWLGVDTCRPFEPSAASPMKPSMRCKALHQETHKSIGDLCQLCLLLGLFKQV